MYIAPLFDRLADTPGTPGGSSSASARQGLVESVARELQLMLNTHGAPSLAEIERFPAIGSSVLNYGMPSLTGVAASAVNAGTVADRIRLALHDFEPRLKDVRVVAQPVDLARPELRFHIRGLLSGGNGEAPIVLETQIGLGSGDVAVAAGG